MTESGVILGAQFWNPSAGQYESHVPVVGLGQAIGVRAFVSSSSARRQNMRMDFAITDPQGLAWTVEGEEMIVSPELEAMWDLLLSAQEEGTYLVGLSLKAEELEETNFSLDPPEIEPEVVTPGTRVTIRATVTNIGSAQGGYIMECYVNGMLIGNHSRAINPGNSHTNIYTFYPQTIGIYNILVVADGLSQQTQVEATPALPGEPNIHDGANSPLCEWLGGKAWGSLWPVNSGTGTGEYTLEWYIDDILVKTDGGVLAAGAYQWREISEDLPAESVSSIARVGTHTMHCILRWNGHEDRYPMQGDGYNRFVVPE